MKSNILIAAVLSACAVSVHAWDYEGHRLVNQIGLASLPANFPAFVITPEAAERIAFLAGEPDRWRNTDNLSLKHCNGPDHYIDLEEVGHHGLKLDELPVFRCDFVGHLATNRAAQPGKFPEVDPAKNEDHTRELVGLLPWAITENYGKLKSGFSYLKAYQEHGGTAEEIANAQANIIYIMGVMGHYVGDGSQPLHTTVHHAGWVGANPNNYRTNKSIHQWIDGGYFNKVGIPRVADLKKDIRTAQLVKLGSRDARPEEIFAATVEYIAATSKEVEPLYQRDKAGELSGNGTKGLEGRKYLTDRLIVGGQMLGDIWYSAWQQATPDNYLKGQLQKRKRAEAAK
jgi:hypothetical protein